MTVSKADLMSVPEPTALSLAAASIIVICDERWPAAGSEQDPDDRRIEVQRLSPQVRATIVAARNRDRM